MVLLQNFTFPKIHRGSKIFQGGQLFLGGPNANFYRNAYNL